MTVPLIIKTGICPKSLMKDNSLNLPQTNESGLLFLPIINGGCKCKKN